MHDNSANIVKLKTLYLHGFLSSGDSQKGRWLLERNNTDETHPLGNLLTPTYSQVSLSEGLKAVQQQLETWQQSRQPFLLMGSSLGGFFAQYYGHRFQVPYIMINPALNPQTLFSSYLGKHTNPYTGEQILLDQYYCDDLARFELPQLNPAIPSLLLADENDEVVDIDFAVQQYRKCENSTTLLFPGGNHAFMHMEESWPEIKRFIQQNFER